MQSNIKNEQTVVISNLSIGYSKNSHTKIVGSDISAALNSGELTCLLGSNGVGKSTLLKTLSSFLPKIKGNIYFLNKEIEEYSSKNLSQILSVVLTDKCDILNMSVREMIGLGRSPYTGFWGTMNKEDKMIVDETIEFIKIEKLANRMMHTLSDGEKQKVMIAKAMAQQTPLIFLDEPTAFLDFPSKVEIMQLLHYLSRMRNKTILLSTHDLELALQIGDKIWLMDRKNGISIGTPEDLALSGDLGNYFSCKGISFDSDTGLFKIENEYSKEITIKGKHGPNYAMVRKALRRNGIKASMNIKSNIVLTVNSELPQPYIIEYEGGISSFTTIEELCIWARTIGD